MVLWKLAAVAATAATPQVMATKLAQLSSLSVVDLGGAPKPFASLYEPGGAVVMLVRRMG